MAALASISAFAQSTVAITGNIDLGYRNVKETATSAAGVSQSRNVKAPIGNGAEGWTSSQVVLTISEDLGNGVKAGYVSDMNLNSWGAGADSANQALATQRQSFLTLSDAKMGELRLGYQYTLDDQIQGGIGRATPTGNVGGRIQNFGLTTGPGTATANDITSGAITRTNAFQYATPVMSGFQGLVQFASQADTRKVDNATPNDGLADGKWQSVAVKYSQGPLNLGLASSKQVVKTDTVNTANLLSETTQKLTNFAANYDLGMAKIYGNYFKRKANVVSEAATNLDKTDRKGYDLGVSVPMGKTTLFASMGKGKFEFFDNSASTDTNYKVTGRLLGATYDLSKRTSLNAYYSVYKATGEEDAVGASAKRTNIGAGLRHQF